LRLAIDHVGPLRRLALDQARKRVGKKTSPASYPAPFRALEAIEASLAQPPAQGFDIEARLVGELIPTRTSRNLIWLFMSRSAVKRDLGAIRARPRPVRRLAVLGAGVMGGGIARLAADHGTPVRLKDLRYEAILDALRTAHGVWDEKAKRGEISRREIDRRSAFIAPTLDDSGLCHTDLVIEAVVEELETKQEVLAAAERRIGEQAVFASNTSCLPISEIAARAVRPGRVIGMHFFNPVHRMPLVEVIAGRHSSPEAVATAHAYALRLGKVPVIVKDEPGFLVNRILMLYLNEALVMLREGTKVEALDRAMLDFGLPTGPFGLLDHVGLESAERVGGVLRVAYGERIGGDESVLGAMIADNRLGRRNGRGFYRYRDGKPTIPDSRVRKLLGTQTHREIPAETLQERMVLAMINEAVICLQDGVVRNPREVDVAMVLGAGFPPFRGGPLRYADEIGVPILVDRLERLADAHGDRFRPADALREMVRKQHRFYD
jgi:3-hydroxyacyl-CoA dehydrogenase/enoyl-CoA hydratase/3-hydroxybutyryl-CoA epimerase